MNYLDPWPEPVDGAEELYAIEAQFRRHVSMPDGSPEIVALWTMFTWAIDASQIAPRLFLTSPGRQCGKTTVLHILRGLCARPEANSNATPAALYHAIHDDHCTLILDEADNFIGRRGPLNGILNAGYSRATAYVRRVIGGTSVRFSIYGAVAIAGLGRLSATLEDRSIIVRMRRKKPTAQLEKFRQDRTTDLTELARKAMRWAADNEAALKAADPEIPEGISDRAADNVRILLAIADVAQGGWPERARRAVLLCCAEHVEAGDETDIIRDICEVFEKHTPKMRSADLCRELMGLDRRYKSLTPNALARLLDPFEIRPQVLRFGNQTPRGYERGQFDDVVESYAITLDDAPTRAPARPSATSATLIPTQRQSVDEYMTAVPVAEAIMRTTERVIAAEARAQQEAQARENAPRLATKTAAGREQGRSP